MAEMVCSASFKNAYARESGGRTSFVSIQENATASAVSRFGRLMVRKMRSGCVRDFGITKSKRWSKPLLPVNFTFGIADAEVGMIGKIQGLLEGSQKMLINIVEDTRHVITLKITS